MPPRQFETEEHELPSTEAMLACALALMTGYSQALQADLHPAQRLTMGLRISDNLSVLARQPMLSPGFQRVLEGLQQRWSAMTACTMHSALGTRHPAPGCTADDQLPRFTLTASTLLH